MTFANKFNQNISALRAFGIFRELLTITFKFQLKLYLTVVFGVSFEARLYHSLRDTKCDDDV